MVYMLFGASDHGEGGGHDFKGVYPTRDAAHAAALTLWFVNEPRLSSWVHIAEFDGQYMRVTHRLNIPDTEYDKHGELVWVSY